MIRDRTDRSGLANIDWWLSLSDLSPLSVIKQRNKYSVTSSLLPGGDGNYYEPFLQKEERKTDGGSLELVRPVKREKNMKTNRIFLLGLQTERQKTICIIFTDNFHLHNPASVDISHIAPSPE